ncbi:hypothetical protein CGRA01v4_09034 [Colletotrichum graminicola]|uniref:Uncharacterized protein n=1 Tax=Colletotrichum graminicola (strain M1.001 / M2 / FGSC 10212) TaxID=645133 RepID=E3Q781_COLGM|nr:uncharacterized protein GLRG_02539 [Colletotrichum graminicola M1.001]EFQ26719.1 hypothetical protein GLRG_02539 [Colletotrichum graminicola M1.001]WDK17751.1 hypothetical protein CGRA01v4_09034 [Colletotrichum graminicola]
MRVAALAAFLSTALASVPAGLALSRPDARLAVRGEERQNAKFPKEMDLMEELMRRAATYCPGAYGGDKNECYWKLRGAWPGYPDDYASSTPRTGRPPSASRSLGGGVLGRGGNRVE